MRHVALAVIAGAIGGLAGLLLGRLVRGALPLSIAASIVGMLAGSLVGAVAWILRPPAGIDVLAVSVGLTEAVVATCVVGVAATLVHFTMETLLSGGSRLLSLRPVLLGAGAGIIGVVGFAFGAAVRGVR